MGENDDGDRVTPVEPSHQNRTVAAIVTGSDPA